jgi:5-(carboxyamino)imidazole ribonucleotide synthase
MKIHTRTLGILGGGQLGRMSALAATRLGVNVHIYNDVMDCPAAQVSAKTFAGGWDDRKALKAFAESVDVITYEFENIPVETVRFLQTLKPVWPDDRLLEIAQHRATEKKFLNDIGIHTAGWTSIHGSQDIEQAAQTLGGSAFILKTARFGYDGKGQAGYKPGDDVGALWNALGEQELVIESKVDFACEVSMIVARDKTGQTALYGPILNHHKNGILDQSIVPAPVSAHVAEVARETVRQLADAVDLVGVLALEMFVTRDDKIIANEIAPRTHNSGHWTIDACACSQFEQHVRAVCGMPVGDPARHSDAVMHNLIGTNALSAGEWLTKPGACLHLYGKGEAREGRKMGHVTVLKTRKID